MNLESALQNIGTLDTLAEQDTWVHRRDPRAKLLATLMFIAVVASFPKYAFGAMLPLALFPVVMISLGNVPMGWLLRRLLLALPFVIFVAVFNPIFDRSPHVLPGGSVIAAGWVSFGSILLRFVLAVSAAFILLAATGFQRACHALQQMGVPRIFVVQLLFLYRYLFVVAGEAGCLARAHSLRNGTGRPPRPAVFASLIGNLLLRSMDRAQRIHTAMLCRGFDGEIRTSRGHRFTLADGLFVAGWAAFFITARAVDLPQWLGQAILGIGA